MIQLLIRSIVRLILKNKTLSFVKIIGLSLGTSVFLLASLFCIDELNFDRQHPGYQNIYRYVHNVSTPEGLQSFAFTSATIGPALLERFPEVKNFTRIIFPQVSVSNVGSDAIFYEGKFGFADPNFFSIFNFPLDHEGDPGVVLKHPLSVVLTPRSVSRYFGSEDPIGKTLLISGELQFTVTGVLEQIPTDSHIDFDFIASFSSLEVIKNHPVVSQQIPASVNLDTKGFNAFYTYLLLAPGTNPANLESKFPQFIEEFRGKGKSERLKPTLQSLESIHLNSSLLYEIQPNGSSATVLVFLFVGVIIIGIACINYINISTAEFISRAPGTGLKKILGVTRTTLVVSHLTETAALAIFSVITGCAIVWGVLPGFNTLVGRHIQLMSYNAIWVILCILCVVVLVSGIYPAIMISRIKSIEALKGREQSRSAIFSVRNALVSFQLFASFSLLTVSFLIGDQLTYLLNRDPGFDSRGVIVLNAISANSTLRTLMKTKLTADQNILAVGMCSLPPGEKLFSMGITLRENRADDERRIAVYHSFVDSDYLRALGVEINKGRFFDELIDADSNAYLIINKAAEKQIGPGVMGKGLELPGVFAKESVVKNVMGVMNDFNFASLHEEIQPLVLEYAPHRCNYLLVRTETATARETIERIEKQWKETMPMTPFDYTFLDAKFAQFYTQEQYQKQVISFISLISIVLTSLGIFGTTLFLVERRSKEVGIRKVLGADKRAIMLMLFKPVFYLLLFSCIVAVPVAGALGDQWLNQYPFRTEFSPRLFLNAFFIMLSIVLCTVLYHFLRITKTNPTEVLKQGN